MSTVRALQTARGAGEQEVRVNAPSRKKPDDASERRDARCIKGVEPQDLQARGEARGRRDAAAARPLFRGTQA